jgi:DNA repair protein RadC
VTERPDWHQEDFFAAYDETPSLALPEAPEHAMLREVMSEYLNLESLRFLASEVAASDLRFALRYAPDELPEHIARLVDTIKVILTPSPREQIKSPHDLAAILMLQVGFLQQEQMGVACLDTKNRLQKLHMVYQGSLNTSMVRVTEIFREPIKLNSAGIIVYHSHPSGDPTPSPEDVLVTQEIVSVGRLLDCECMDHLVVSDGRWVSMREKNSSIWHV